MKKTLLLCFIHGFKGGEDTFGARSEFAQHLAALLSAALPKVDVQAITYPKYETRGDLGECVSRFRDWLLERVIDIEVANGTPSPTVDPSVHTILIGHSMGGIVAADTVIALANDKPIPHGESGQGAGDRAEQESPVDGLNSLMFPYVQGILAFDTPFLGIAPGVVAHGAESHYNNAAAALTQLSGLSTAFWGSGGKDQPPAENKRPVAALPAPEAEKPNAPKGGGWGNWGKIAMFAGAAGAVAAGGAAAYMNREHITTGWSWVSSHLEFVGCLARGEELKNRVRTVARLNKELDIGFANLYTRLGKAAAPKQVSMVGTVLGNQRTFCNLPSKLAAGVWREAINDAAADETGAHMTMFEAKDNPGYEQLTEDAKDLIVSWSKNEWYEASTRGNLE
ncbi:putative catalytic [Rosellinia necatrix]|uniref:Putative catalytic n=1 Tax=Rosellinia necatrix TaxID=77044 RepID=A0A1W2TET7_ROSNE|nr:putative catalytic [Rosellinia necatrix]